MVITKTKNKMNWFYYLLLPLFVLGCIIGVASQSDALALSVQGGGAVSGRYRFFQPNSIGGSYLVDAVASVGLAAFDTKTGSKPALNSLPATVSTILVTSTAGGITAQAVGAFMFKSTTYFPLVISDRPSFALIMPLNTPKQCGRAAFIAEDPLDLTLDAGSGADVFEGSFSLEEGFGFQADISGTASYSYEAGSNVSGLDSLFNLDVTLIGLNSPVVYFQSNPSLGLTDSVIKNSIETALLNSFNPSSNSYFLGSDLPLFNFEIPIMEGETVSLSFKGQGSVTVVPEPATLTMFVVGIICLITFGLRLGWVTKN